MRNGYMLNIEKIADSELEYKDEVIDLVNEAVDYLKSFSWCKKISSGWLAKDFGYILCIFYFEIEPLEGSNADNNLWVIVGDLPPAYLDTIECNTPHEAVEIYCFLMEEWIESVKEGKPLENCYPISVEPTIEHANMLHSRIESIKRDYLPYV